MSTTRHGLAHEAMGGRGNTLGLRLRLHVQHLALDQLAVTCAAAATGDGAVAGGKCLGRDAPAPRGLRHQQLAHLRRGIEDRRAAVLERIASGRVALVGRERRIGGHDRDRIEGNRELFRGDLLQRGAHALAQLALAGEYRDGPVGPDADPRIEHRIAGEGSGQLRPFAGRRMGLRKGARREREREHQRPAPHEELAPRDLRQEVAVHFAPIRSRARPTARKMRMWVPQRQRFGSSAARISSSFAPGFFSSRACARIIIPGMQ